MTISLKAAGAWVENVAAAPTVTLVGTPSDGDRYYIFATWKTYTITASMVSGWTEVTEFADGAVATGNGVGSMKVACWYRDWRSGDGDPTLTFSTATNLLSAITCQLWGKGSTEYWEAPTRRTAAWPAQTTGAVNATAAVVVPDGSVVMCLTGFRNDLAAITRAATTAVSASPALTWTGDWVESPATHHTSTTGNDFAADLGHRFVTTGHSATTLSANATISTADTGAILWIVQGLSTCNGSANWLNHAYGVADRNGVTTHTVGHSGAATVPSNGCSLNFVPQAGSLLAVFMGGAVTHTSSGTGAGSGWTKQEGPVNSAEVSLFTKTAAGNDFITITHNGGNYPCPWAFFEFASGSAYIDSTSNTNADDVFTALTGLPGTSKLILAAFGFTLGVSVDHRGGASVSGPWVEYDESIVSGTPTDGMFMHVFYQEGVTATSITPVIASSVSGSTQATDRQKVGAAFTVVAPTGVEPVFRVVNKSLSVAVHRAGFY